MSEPFAGLDFPPLDEALFAWGVSQRDGARVSAPRPRGDSDPTQRATSHFHLRRAGPCPFLSRLNCLPAGRGFRDAPYGVRNRDEGGRAPPKPSEGRRDSASCNGERVGNTGSAEMGSDERV